MRRVGFLIAALVALAAPLLLSACGDTAASSASASSGVDGILLTPALLHANSPTPLPGGFGLASDWGRPYPGAAVQVCATYGAAPKVMARVQPSGEALFHVPLPPGTYTLTAYHYGHWQEPLGGATQVTVTADRFARARVFITQF
jgi:hypothetical protein